MTYLSDYYLGVHMTPTAVGWAVTDPNYDILKAKRKDMWGIREFEEAETAAFRRTKRTNRRRQQRERVRIGLLKTYFSDAILSVDPYFFVRLDNSKYHLDDKPLTGKNCLFADFDYTDKDYYEEYPTIFHLRKELLHNKAPHDVRLVFLAILNMFKHRGHFLNASLSTNENSNQTEQTYAELVELLNEYTDIALPVDIDFHSFEAILSNRNYSKSKKAEKLLQLLNIDSKNKRTAAVIKTLCGLKTDLKLLFEDLSMDKDVKIQICFSDSGYDEKLEELSSVLSENYLSIIECMKMIYDNGILSEIMKGYEYLSDARVASYDKHKYDLVLLKSIIRKYKSPKEYDLLFREPEDGSYSAYVNGTNSEIKQRRSMKQRKAEDFYKTIKKYLKDLPKEDENISYILSEIEKENFMPKQINSSNGVIPNQVHTKELKRILFNAEAYLPFLKETDESGLSVTERILALFTFQIPYYVGPTTENSKRNKGNGWVVRKENGPILPWNIEQKIDMKRTSEEFISRLVRQCTYIHDEKVIPKSSLLYESYCVLNEINNIRIDGNRLSVPAKQELYSEVFQKGKTVTRKQIVNFFYAKGLLKDGTQLSGIGQTIGSSLSTYGKFKAILGERIDTDECQEMIEEIVFWCTVYGDSKKYLKEKIEEQYSDLLTDEQINRILGFKTKDWGNLSKEFLLMPGCDKSTGEKMSLIRTMWENNINLMELLNSDLFTYKDVINAKQTSAMDVFHDFKYEDLDEYYLTPAAKRMVWQTINIIKEVEKVMNKPPKRLFLTMNLAPNEFTVKDKNMREKELLEAYSKESSEWKNLIKSASESGLLKSKKMYLYITQKGRCMYTGKEISLDELFTDKFDIDHIYPKHFVLDNNMYSNLVLVCKNINKEKDDHYPVSDDIYNSQKCFWKELFLQKLITEEKYQRLINRNPFTDEQLAEFIHKQISDNSQRNKSIYRVLSCILPKTEIIYAKKSNVSDFRQHFDLPKCVSINNFHYAHDAYLNIIVGNIYFVKFTKNPLNFIKNEYNRDKKKNGYNLNRMFDWDIVRGKEIAWVSSNKLDMPPSITRVKAHMAKNTPLYTRLSFEGHGGIANETLYAANKTKEEGYIPLKGSSPLMSDMSKYGGFTSLTVAYFFLVAHGSDKKRLLTLETVPLYLKDRIENRDDGLLWYCNEYLHLINPDIKIPKIKIQSLFKINGYFMNISGKSGNQITMRNAVNMCLKPEWNKYIKGIENACKNEHANEELINKDQNEKLYLELAEKHKQSIYARKPNCMGVKLENAYDKFCRLDSLMQCKVLLQILKLSSIGTAVGDLRLLDLSANSGKIAISKNISYVTECKLINQSVTGLFDTTIDLLK